MKLRIREIQKVCLAHPGMWDDFWRAGKKVGSELEISRAAFDEINRKYFDGPRLGTFLQHVLKPVAKAVDMAMGTSLEHCGRCAERELKLNELSRGEGPKAEG